jgi:hypothetical protein
MEPTNRWESVMFTLKIEMTNAAFDDGDGGRWELVRILRDTADRIEGGAATLGLVRDTNGNKVGHWEWTA